MNDQFISFEDAAKALNLSRPTVRWMFEKGRIPGLVEHWGVMRVDRKTFEDWHVSQRSVKLVK